MELRSVGRAALLLDGLDDVAAWQRAVARLVADGRLDPDDVVPGARTLLLDGVDVAAARVLLAPLRPVTGAQSSGGVVRVPVVYDGADLAEVAALWGVGVRDVVARHTATQFRVAFCGFAPGFPYLTGLDATVPRRATPRTRVPAGAVGLAGRYCGIYPGASPGGWQLLGRTGLRLFDPDRDPPALLPPGTRVRFVETDHLDEQAGGAAPRPTPQDRPARRALTVLRPGARTTVQDAGRTGQAHLGVPRAGPLDRSAAALANRLVGNPPGAALLETTLDGVALRLGSAMTVAVTGALAPTGAGGRAVDSGLPLSLREDDVLDVGPAVRGLRSYVAVAGGLQVAAVLGSRSTDTLSGLGPPPLTTGQVLPVGEPVGDPPPVDGTTPVDRREVLLRVTAGPRAEWCGGLGALLVDGYRVSGASDRVGCRLVGPPLPRTRRGELASEGMVLGAVQVPPDGQPVVLLADHPTTGGYPVVAVVEAEDLDALAQARPGTPVRFRRHP